MNSVELAFKLLDELHSKNIEAYLVGGTSRDYLLHHDFLDIDICSKEVPSINKEAMNDYELVSKDGMYYGVLKYLIDDKDVEITTLRKEGKYIKNRRPEKVEFIKDLEVDSLRRDFTINAIYVDYKGNIYDYHNGVSDLNNKIINMIGDPLVRINEDALRILRAIRLSAKLNFKLDENLKDIILKNYELVYSLNKTTLRKEINKFLEFLDLELVKKILKDFNIELEKIYEY